MPTYNSLKKNKVPWNKFNEENQRLFQRKLHVTEEKSKKTSEDGKIAHVCGLVESTL
jgi:hypothetical protein